MAEAVQRARGQDRGGGILVRLWSPGYAPAIPVTVIVDSSEPLPAQEVFLGPPLSCDTDHAADAIVVVSPSAGGKVPSVTSPSMWKL